MTMLVSVLLSCLFFGLISMILPFDRRSEWVYFLLIVVLMISVGTRITEIDFTIPDVEEFTSEYDQSLPEAAAVESAVSTHVLSLTGSAPISVDCDLRREGKSYRLTRISVVITKGEEKEVQSALETAFSFRGFTVVREKTDQSDQALGVSP